jgi:hypothetical protein
VRLERALLETRLGELAAELARAEVQTVEDLLALLLLTSDELEDLPATVGLNTDDNALIEFGAPKDLLAFAESDPDLTIIDRFTGKRAALVKKLGGIGDDPAEALQLAWGYLRRGMLADAEATATLVLKDDTSARPAQEAALEINELAGLLGEEEDREAVVDAEVRQASREFTEASALLAKGETRDALARFEADGGKPPREPKERLLYAYLLFARASYDDGMYARAVTEMQQYRRVQASFLAAAREAQ